MNRSEEILKEAQNEAGSAESWTDLSNAIFDPENGLLAKAFPTREQREQFIKTPAYRQLKRLIADAMERHGLMRGAKPRKSGRFVVRLPASLHAALAREAVAEGVSLNQLVVSKLAAKLNSLADDEAVIRPHLDAHQGSSTDLVVADPERNR